jgi:hypothetical protein
MTASMSRVDWLAEEIRADREYGDRFENSDDPVERAQAVRRLREAVDKERELHRLSGGAQFSLRLTGTPIEGNLAPIAVVKAITQQLENLADDFGAEMLVAPAAAGSHIIEVTSSPQGSLFPADPQFDPDEAFAAAAGVLVALSAPGGDQQRWEGTVEQVASDLSPAALLAARRFVEVLSDHHLNVDMQLQRQNRQSNVRLTSQDATFVRTVLSNVERNIEEVQYVGVLNGFTKGTGRFEIEVDGDEIAGRVPKSLRSAAEGIPFGSRVVITAERVVTTLRSGAVREHLRLISIDPG